MEVHLSTTGQGLDLRHLIDIQIVIIDICVRDTNLTMQAYTTNTEIHRSLGTIFKKNIPIVDNVKFFIQ